MKLERNQIETLKAEVLQEFPDISKGELYHQVLEALINQLGLPRVPVDPTGEYPGVMPDYNNADVQQISRELRRKFSTSETNQSKDS